MTVTQVPAAAGGLAWWPGWLAPSLVLVVHLVTTQAMVGVIWFVQVVHYPLFGGVGAAEFRAYAAAHGRRTTWVVAPPMLLEVGTALLLVWRRPVAMPAWSAWAGLLLLAVVWGSTFGLQVPRHEELGAGFDARAHRRLVRTNWLRTTAWTARGALVAWVALRALAG